MFIQELTELLHKKLALFLKFEQFTQLLSSCDIDSMPDYIIKRSDLANETDNVTENIVAICNNLQVVPSASDILSVRCDYAVVPPEWQPLFLKSQEILGVVTRTAEANDYALMRMKDLQAQLKSRISDTKNTSRIIKYISSSGVVQQERGVSIRDQKI